MIIIAGTLAVDPEKADAAAEVLEKEMDASQTDAGVQKYIVSRDFKDPSVFHFFEIYDSMDALVAHVGADHSQEFMAAIPSLNPRDISLIKYEVSSSEPMDPANPPGS